MAKKTDASNKTVTNKSEKNSRAKKFDVDTNQGDTLSASPKGSKKTAKAVTKQAKSSKRSIKSVTSVEAVSASTVIEPGTDEATIKQAKKSKKQSKSFTSALRVRPNFELADLDADSTPGFDGGRKAAEKLMAATADELADLQERLYASQRHVGGTSVLLVVQGMDTSGKGGIMRHVVGLLDPQGVELTSFKAPTKQEQAHPFLWRIRNALPKPGYIGVFDRSQYEDVLVVRVHDLVARPVWMRRYGQINAFEASAVDKGMVIIKVMLHIDADEQKARLAERLADPAKFYKFNPGDLVERSYWPEYQEAYQAVLDRTSTPAAPWFVVPANHKWYARLAVQQLLLEHLRALDLSWPEPPFDVEEQKALLAES